VKSTYHEKQWKLDLIFFETDFDRTSNKRQRTSSESPSLLSHSIRQGASQALDSDEEGATGRTNGGSRRVRGAAARGQRDRELREQERDKERQRMDAAGRRKGRAERRRGDGNWFLVC
jgi:hypothetical protein